jgi:hypothetical protein
VDLRLALDQNFPKPILDALGTYIKGAELRPVGDMNVVAQHSNVSPAHLRKDHALSTAEMGADPLAHIDPTPPRASSL